MSTSQPDVAAIRHDNALVLFDEFVQQAARTPDAAALRGLEGRFAEKLGIQPSYWSQIKSRSRQIGERLARQFEEAMKKPWGWMDQSHPRVAALAAAEPESNLPVNDDERFVVSLVLSYYRRNPARARTRLLDLLAEAMTPAAAPSQAPARASSPAAADEKLWASVAQHVAPLKRKR